MKLDFDHVQHLAARADVTPNTFRGSPSSPPLPAGARPSLTAETYTVVAACLFIPFTGAIWHTPYVRDAFVGPKVFVIFTHEMFHVLTGVLCGGRLQAFVIDPNLGGYTGVSGLKRTLPRVPDPYTLPTPEQLFWSPSVVATLMAGPLGSAVVGFLYIVSSPPSPHHLFR